MTRRMTAFGLVVLSVGAAVYSTVGAEPPMGEAAKAKGNTQAKGSARVVVGTFDSRAVAVAYVRSDGFRRQLTEMKAELKKAKAAGNDKRVKELEAEGPAMQALFHKQSFGTWPVDDILEKINDKLPDVAAEAKVDLIVSKWHVVYQRPAIEFVDVTDLLVKQFAPDAETLKVIESLRKQKPVSLEELSKHDHH